MAPEIRFFVGTLSTFSIEFPAECTNVVAGSATIIAFQHSIIFGVASFCTICTLVPQFPGLAVSLACDSTTDAGSDHDTITIYFTFWYLPGFGSKYCEVLFRLGLNLFQYEWAASFVFQ